MQNTGNDGIFVHVPLFENLHDGEWMDNIWLASLAKLTFVRFGGDVDGLLNAWRFGARFSTGFCGFGHIILSVIRNILA